MKNAKPFEKSNFQCNAIRQPAGHVEETQDKKINKNGEQKDNFKEKRMVREGEEKKEIKSVNKTEISLPLK
jgi:hypothetical protein